MIRAGWPCPGRAQAVPPTRRGGFLPVRHRHRRGQPALRPEAGFGYETEIALDPVTRRGATDAPRPLAQENVLITDPQALRAQAGARASRRQDRAARWTPAFRAIAGGVRTDIGAPPRGTLGTAARS